MFVSGASPTDVFEEVADVRRCKLWDGAVLDVVVHDDVPAGGDSEDLIGTTAWVQQKAISLLPTVSDLSSWVSVTLEAAWCDVSPPSRTTHVARWGGAG